MTNKQPPPGCPKRWCSLNKQVGALRAPGNAYAHQEAGVSLGPGRHLLGDLADLRAIDGGDDREGVELAGEAAAGDEVRVGEGGHG